MRVGLHVSGWVSPHIVHVDGRLLRLGQSSDAHFNLIWRKQMLMSNKHSHPLQLAEFLFPPFNPLVLCSFHLLVCCLRVCYCESTECEHSEGQLHLLEKHT